MGDALDYSYARPDPHEIKNRGYEVVFRYLGTDARCITPQERDRLHAAGLRIALIGQGQIKRPLSGYAGGWNDAESYNWMADNLGFPRHVPIFYVVDVGQIEGGGGSFPLPSHWGTITQFFQGIIDCTNAKGLRPVGGYGPYSIMENVFKFLPMHCYWQTAGDTQGVMGTGTGGGIHNPGDRPNTTRKVSTLPCAYQCYGGERFPAGQTDHNIILKRPVEDWSWHPSDPAPHEPQSDEEEEDEDMITYARTKAGSEWALKVLGTNAGEHWFSMSGGIVRHIGPAEKELLDALLWVEAASGVPENKRTIVRAEQPLDDHWFTAAHSFHPRSLPHAD